MFLLSYRTRLVFESMTIASLLALVDIIIGFISYLINPSFGMLSTTSTFLFIEFALMLIVGGCMMAREPLEDEKKFAPDGNPVVGWRMTLIGRKILLGGAFAFLFSLLFFALDLIL